MTAALGAEGWFTARRRNRLWAFLSGPAGGAVVAQRGFTGWERLLDGSGDPPASTPTGEAKDPRIMVLTSEAAAPLVVNLVTTFHGPESKAGTSFGPGWSVSDEPDRPDGLVGGTFDDAGFPSRLKPLASCGVWVGRLGGPGSFHRGSYREPPTESPTNLTMAPGEVRTPPRKATHVRRCRVLRPSAELWVLELQSDGAGPAGDPDRRWVRTPPRALLEACTSRLGPSMVTPAGPIVPSLVLEGLEDS